MLSRVDLIQPSRLSFHNPTSIILHEGARSSDKKGLIVQGILHLSSQDLTTPIIVRVTANEQNNAGLSAL